MPYHPSKTTSKSCRFTWAHPLTYLGSFASERPCSGLQEQPAFLPRPTAWMNPTSSQEWLIMLYYDLNNSLPTAHGRKMSPQCFLILPQFAPFLLCIGYFDLFLPVLHGFLLSALYCLFQESFPSYFNQQLLIHQFLAPVSPGKPSRLHWVPALLEPYSFPSKTLS